MRKLVLLALLLAACASDPVPATSGASSTSEVATQTTSAATPTSAAEQPAPPASSDPEPMETTTTAATTTSSAVGRYEVVDPSLAPFGLPTTDGASGSGCSPGPGDLPDGIWFGIVGRISTDTIDIDLACFFVGDNANEAAAEDGHDEVPVPNDYYIRNESPVIRTVPIAPDATAWIIGGDPSGGLSEVEWEVFATDDPVGFVPCPGESCLVWLYVNDGEVTELVTQYTP